MYIGLYGRSNATNTNPNEYIAAGFTGPESSFPHVELSLHYFPIIPDRCKERTRLQSTVNPPPRHRFHSHQSSPLNHDIRITCTKYQFCTSPNLNSKNKSIRPSTPEPHLTSVANPSTSSRKKKEKKSQNNHPPLHLLPTSPPTHPHPPITTSSPPLPHHTHTHHIQPSNPLDPLNPPPTRLDKQRLLILQINIPLHIAFFNWLSSNESRWRAGLNQGEYQPSDS